MSILECNHTTQVQMQFSAAQTDVTLLYLLPGLERRGQQEKIVTEFLESSVLHSLPYEHTTITRTRLVIIISNNNDNILTRTRTTI